MKSRCHRHSHSLYRSTPGQQASPAPDPTVYPQGTLGKHPPSSEALLPLSDSEMLGFAACGEWIARCRKVDDSESIAWEALAKALSGFHSERGPFVSRYFHFLRCGIADHFRKPGNRQRTVALGDVAQRELATFEGEVSVLRPSCLRSVLDQFPEGIVAIPLLHHGYGVSVEELAKREGVKISAMKMRLKRGRELLAAMLRAAHCFNVDDVEELGARGMPIHLSPLLPARRQSRPSCKPRPSKPM